MCVSLCARLSSSCVHVCTYACIHLQSLNFLKISMWVQRLRSKGLPDLGRLGLGVEGSAHRAWGFWELRTCGVGHCDLGSGLEVAFAWPTSRGLELVFPSLRNPTKVLQNTPKPKA